MKTNAQIKHYEIKQSTNLPLNSFHVGHLLSAAGHGAHPSVWSVYPVKLHWGKQILSLQAAVSWEWLGWEIALLSPLSPGTLSDLNLCRPCACACHRSLCEVIWASVLLCPEDAVSSASSVPVGSDNLPASSASILSTPMI